MRGFQAVRMNEERLRLKRQETGLFAAPEVPVTVRPLPCGRGVGESDASCAGEPHLSVVHARIFHEGRRCIFPGDSSRTVRQLAILY